MLGIFSIPVFSIEVDLSLYVSKDLRALVNSFTTGLALQMFIYTFRKCE